MAYLTETQVLERASRVTDRMQKTASLVLESISAPADDTFDVFLSHSSAESEKILRGIKMMLEDCGLKVYVDKYCDPQLSPDKVTLDTADILRNRMRHSNTLLYVYSHHSKKSRWMPWELGFFDGLKGAVGVIPVTLNQEETFKGEEYLNLYPYVDEALVEGSSETRLWINKSKMVYASFDKWAKGTEKIRKQD